jgi:hypothetical protein
MLREMAERGEHDKAGDNQNGSNKVLLPDLGVTKTQSSRWAAEMARDPAAPLARMEMHFLVGQVVRQRLDPAPARPKAVPCTLHSAPGGP